MARRTDGAAFRGTRPAAVGRGQGQAWMSDQGIRSRPSYTPIARAAAGRFHLLVADTAEPDRRAFAPAAGPDDFDERWMVEARSTAISSPLDGATRHGFRSTSHLLIALPQRLAHAQMGLRLYVIGAEPFLWEVAAVAEAHGLGRDEYRLHPSGSRARRLFCVHCRTIAEGVTTNVATCPGCGARLFVRDHFSRRLNAFMGVQIDAEVPGETIPVEELYR